MGVGPVLGAVGVERRFFGPALLLPGVGAAEAAWIGTLAGAAVVATGVPGGLVAILNCWAGAVSPLPCARAAGKWLLITSTRVPTPIRSKSWMTSCERMRMQP